MKVGIIILILLLLIGIYRFRKKSLVYIHAPGEFIQLESKTESTDYLPTVEKNWLKETELKYAEKEWESYPNEHSELSEKLCDDVYDHWKGEISHTEFLNKLTVEQRMYIALNKFEAQTNNGGVYQFLFNYPELAIITLAAMKEAKMGDLTNDYEKVLHEFFGKFNTIQELYKQFQDGSKKWDKRWNSFVEGYKELPSTQKIEEYFYNNDYQKEYQSKMVQFVKDNANGLMKIE